MNGTNFVIGACASFLCTVESRRVSLGLPHGLQVFLLGVDLGLPDANSWAVDTVAKGWTQVLAYASACFGIVLVVYFVRAFRS